MRLKNNTIVFLLFIIGLLGTCAACMGEEAAQPVPKTVTISKNLYAITGLGESGNVSFLVTKEGVVVVDSGEDAKTGGKIMSIIKEKTDRPVRYIILTHYHTDHTLGLQSFPETAVIIGHENLYKNMKEITLEDFKGYPAFLEELRIKIEKLKKEGSPDVKKEEDRLAANLKEYEPLKTSRIIFPNLTFDKKMTLYLGDEIIEIINPGSTHTNCSSVVYFRTQKAIHMADMVFSGFHSYIDDHAGANTSNWINFLRTVKDWDIEKVIPGHGEVGGKDILENEALYLEDLRKEVAAAIAKGLSLEDTQKAVTIEKYKDLQWNKLLRSDIRAVYKELSK